MSKEKQNKEMRDLAKLMGEAISTGRERRYIEDEAKLEAVLRENGWRKQSEGEWIENEDDFWVMCSECGTEFLDDQIGIVDTYNHCPNCGAKMRKEDEGK